MLDRRECLATQRWLNAAVGIGYLIALVAGAGTGLPSHRMPRQGNARPAQASPVAEARAATALEAKGLLASLR